MDADASLVVSRLDLGSISIERRPGPGLPLLDSSSVRARVPLPEASVVRRNLRSQLEADSQMTGNDAYPGCQQGVDEASRLSV
ncbi:MAG TPA: hypothetical protein VKU38_23640 [Ktedonobacteraceae bacterium]|nr:hypothetical protein [Ktedonobacteraceae bacterium]